MRAAVIERYGDSSQFILKDVPDPVIGASDVLIHIKACSINPIDWKIRSGAIRYVYPIRMPAILGFDLAGEVIALGKEVKTLQLGDAVYTCSNKKAGQAYAQRIALSERCVSLKPKNMDFKQAASVPLAAVTALQALRDKGNLKATDHVLIIGASGGVGMFAVQIAKALGARVSAVCSTPNIPFVQALGADEVIDYKTSNVFANANKYNIIFDCVAAHHYPNVKVNLTSTGIYISTLPAPSLLFHGLFNHLTKTKAKVILLRKSKQDLDTITQLIDENKLKTHIDSEFSLNEITLAHQRSETHRAVGKIVISV